MVAVWCSLRTSMADGMVGIVVVFVVVVLCRGRASPPLSTHGTGVSLRVFSQTQDFPPPLGTSLTVPELQGISFDDGRNTRQLRRGGTWSRMRRAAVHSGVVVVAGSLLLLLLLLLFLLLVPREPA